MKTRHIATRSRFLAYLPFAIAVGLYGCSGDPGDSPPVCGNGVLEAGETCDDGNTASGDGCSATCTSEYGWSCAKEVCSTVCGDGMVASGEACDTAVTPWYCAADCKSTTGRCGDGVVQPQSPEKCDPGAAGLRGCNAACLPAFGFACDPSANSCVASGLPEGQVASTLTEDQTRQYCAWMINSLLGGTGNVFVCGSLQYTIGTVDSCTTKQFGNWGQVSACTIAQIEDWIGAAGNQCTLMTDAPHC